MGEILTVAMAITLLTATVLLVVFRNTVCTGPMPVSFFTFIAILFTFSVLMNQMLAVCAAVASSQATVQVVSACLLLFLILIHS